MRYKVKETKKGFIVLELKDVGAGFCYEDTGRRFDSKQEAQAFIKTERGAENEKE